MSQTPGASGRRRVLSTARGSKLGPFGLVEWALLSAVALTWGSTFLLTEIGLESIAPPTITWARVTLGFLVLADLPVARRKVERSDYPRVALVGITWVGVPFLLFPLAQQHIDSALAGMLNGMVPIFSASIAMVLMRWLPRILQIAGVMLGVAGAISISRPVVRESAAGAWGVLLIVIANLLYGVSHNLVVPLQQRYGAPAVMMRAIGVAAVGTAPFGLAGLADSQWSTGPVIAVITMGVIQTGVTFVMMAAFVGRVGATRGGVAIYFIPIVAMILGIVFRSETVLPVQWAGTAIVLLGAWLTSRREA